MISVAYITYRNCTGIVPADYTVGTTGKFLVDAFPGYLVCDRELQQHVELIEQSVRSRFLLLEKFYGKPHTIF
ncbi:hypothetical protein RB195_021863 [Necator americanus]|uniref:Uncharacterized protein n=1 Tax=Necator americanus TaxID=51031 RepID=A0ABR1EDZ9_NECAM